ncbi:MAG: hypothetical protein ACOYKA_01425 [Legionellaceae bacterium]
MRAFLSKLSLSVVIVFGMMGVALANPCMPIAQQCMKEGYYKGGDKEGKGLVKDCVMLVLSNQKSFAGVTFTDETLQQCGAMLKSKMNTQ